MATHRIFKVKVKDGTVHTVDPEKSELPVLPDERHLGIKNMTVIQAAASITPSSLSSGFAVGLLVSPMWGIVAILFGVAGMSIYTLLNTILFAKYGTEQTYLGKAFFGEKGVKLSVGLIGNLMIWGWQCIPVIMIGRITKKLMNLMGYNGMLTNATVWGLVFMVITLCICYRGTYLMSKIYNITIPLMLIMLLVISIVILKNYGISETLFSTQFSHMTRSAYVSAAECGLGYGFSWCYVFGSYAKAGKTENASFNGTVLGYGIAPFLTMIPGILGAAVTGVSDPIDGFAIVGNGNLSIVFLLVVFAANFCSMVTNPYFQSCGLQSMFPKHLKWGYAVAINAIIVPIVIFPAIYDNFAPVLSVFATIGGVISCLWVTDTLLRKFYINLEAAFHPEKDKTYYYQGGFNICGWLCMTIGLAISFAIKNPITGTMYIQTIYDLFGQSIPACLISSLIYIPLYYKFIGPKQKKETIQCA